MPRVSPRRALLAALLAAIPALLVSPVGHGAEPPRHRTIPFEQRARGTCPSQIDPVPAGCVSIWRFEQLERTDVRERSFFVLTSEQTMIRVPFRVTHRADSTRCELPWMDHLSFNQRIPEVCLGPCPESIALRSDGGVARLVAADGVAAHGDPLRCGHTYEGAWTFDATGLRGPLTLRYPALGEIALPSSA